MVFLRMHQEKTGLEKEIELLINKEELQITWKTKKKPCDPELLKAASPKGNRCEQVGK